MKITENIYLVASGKWGFGITQEIDCNVYLISTDAGCILIDSGTGLEPEKMDAVMESHGFTAKDIKAVILTHYHGDHACGASRIQKLSGCPIYAPELEARAIAEGDEKATSLEGAKGGIYPLDFVYPKSDNVVGVRDQETVTVGNVTLTFYMCPGHSLQDMVIYGNIDGKNCLFSGDCVFAHGQVLIQSLYDVSIFPYAEAMRRLASCPLRLFSRGTGYSAWRTGVSYVQAAVDKFNMGLIPQQLYYFT